MKWLIEAFPYNSYNRAYYTFDEGSGELKDSCGGLIYTFIAWATDVSAVEMFLRNRLGCTIVDSVEFEG